jgi:SRSO17 transposase
LTALQTRLAPRFGRPEVRERAGWGLAGLLAPMERRNGWQLAEQLGERSPDGVQRLLRTARGNADAVRDDLRAYVVEPLGDPAAVLVIDETGFLKKGPKSVGVARQDSGTAGRIENGQIGVFLAYAAPGGSAFLDRALSLPKGWTADRARCAAAGVPPAVAFATKGDLAQAMLAQAFAAAVPSAWVTGDEPYGNDGDLRRWLETQDRAYVLAVAGSHPIWRGGAQVRVEALAPDIPADGWQRLAVGAGRKGPRVDDWAGARLPYWTADGRAPWLLIRRSLAKPDDLAFYRAFGPDDTPTEALAQAAGRRWAIEEGFQRAKESGLDQDEVRTWPGASAHHPRLARPRLPHRDAGGNTERRKKGADAELIPVTVPEGRRLLAVLLGDAAQRAFRLPWSRWRRRPQAAAHRRHYRRRFARSDPDVPL